MVRFRVRVRFKVKLKFRNRFRFIKFYLINIGSVLG